jgi:inner membrane protein
MHPATHFLLSWTVADAVGLQPRDRALVTWCGVLADLDGLGLLIDVGNELLGRPDTGYYPDYHHFLLHGLPGALFLSGLLCLFARQRWRVFGWGLVVFHLHLLCDLVGSRGPSPTDLWPIYYLAPLTRHPMLVWQNQWRLNSWQNMALTILLLALVIARAVQRGYSPVGLFHRKTDQKVVEVLRKWCRQ